MPSGPGDGAGRHVQAHPRDSRSPPRSVALQGVTITLRWTGRLLIRRGGAFQGHPPSLLSGVFDSHYSTQLAMLLPDGVALAGERLRGHSPPTLRRRRGRSLLQFSCSSRCWRHEFQHLMASRVSSSESRGLFVQRHNVNEGGTAEQALLSRYRRSLNRVRRTFGRGSRLGLFFIANYTLSFVSLFLLRRREPESAPHAAPGAILRRLSRSPARRFSPPPCRRYAKRVLACSCSRELSSLSTHTRAQRA